MEKSKINVIVPDQKSCSNLSSERFPGRKLPWEAQHDSKVRKKIIPKTWKKTATKILENSYDLMK